jgi:glycosyltransferase involved in cell wall biosynthesis
MGVDLVALSRELPYAPWQKGQPCRIFSCGRLNFCKGHADLIAAIGLLRERGLNAQLEIAGEDEQGGNGYRRELERLILRLKLGNAVRLLGAVSDIQIKQSLELAHIFALASLDEPLGVAIMEAMAMEVPVVVARSRGVVELIDSNSDGVLVMPQSPIQLADAIEALLNESERAIEIGKAGREKIDRRFRSSFSADILLRAIGDIDQRHVRRPEEYNADIL